MRSFLKKQISWPHKICTLSPITYNQHQSAGDQRRRNSTQMGCMLVFQEQNIQQAIFHQRWKP